jgi:hypothetical protein
MTDLDLQHQNLAEALQRRARWHLAAQEWQQYLQTISDLVLLYDNDNATAQRVVALMGAQGQDIAQWLNLANYAQQNLVQAIEHAQTVTQKLVQQEQKHNQKHLRQLQIDLVTRK